MSGLISITAPIITFVMIGTVLSLSVYAHEEERDARTLSILLLALVLTLGAFPSACARIVAYWDTLGTMPWYEAWLGAAGVGYWFYKMGEILGTIIYHKVLGGK